MFKQLWRLIRGPRERSESGGPTYIDKANGGFVVRFDNMTLKPGSREFNRLKRRALRKRAGLSDKCECGRER